MPFRSGTKRGRTMRYGWSEPPRYGCSPDWFWYGGSGRVWRRDAPGSHGASAGNPGGITAHLERWRKGWDAPINPPRRTAAER